VKVGRHEAVIFGLDAPSKSEVLTAAVGQPISDEELGRQWDRLTPDEQDTFMMLLQKLQGRWVEPQTDTSIETTATAVAAPMPEIEPPSTSATPGSSRCSAQARRPLPAVGGERAAETRQTALEAMAGRLRPGSAP
jgi:hypothetical protein